MKIWSKIVGALGVLALTFGPAFALTVNSCYPKEDVLTHLMKTHEIKGQSNGMTYLVDCEAESWIVIVDGASADSLSITKEGVEASDLICIVSFGYNLDLKQNECGSPV